MQWESIARFHWYSIIIFKKAAIVKSAPAYFWYAKKYTFNFLFIISCFFLMSHMCPWLLWHIFFKTYFNKISNFENQISEIKMYNKYRRRCKLIFIKPNYFDPFKLFHNFGFSMSYWILIFYCFCSLSFNIVLKWHLNYKICICS